MLRVVVLGAAAGGGVPQWNCGCPVCRAARTEHPELQSTQASIAISADGDHWFLINASPDLRQQLIATPQLHPGAGKLRHSPIAGVILTNGEIDAVAGLLSMREGWPFTIYAHAKVLAILKSNSIFNVLSEKNVRRQPIEIDKAFEPALPDGSPSGIEILPFEVAGKSAWYLEGKAHPAGDDGAGDTLGLRIRDKATGKYFYFLAACAERHRRPQIAAAGAPLVFFDGTVWRDDELIAAGLGNKTGQGMGHIAMSGDTARSQASTGLDIEQEDIPAYQQLQPGVAARFRRAQDRRARGLANSRRWNGDYAVNAIEASNGMTAFSLGKASPLEQRRGTGSRAPPYRRDALSQPASVSPAAARRQAQQGPGAGLGAEPLLLSEHDPDQGRGGDLALPRPRHPAWNGGTGSRTMTAISAPKAASSAG